MKDIPQIRIPPRVDQLPLPEREIHREPQGWRYQIEGQEFDFRQGKVYLNGEDLVKHLRENLTHLGAHYWTVLSRRLARYRDWATVNVEDPEGLGGFFALVHALLTKIFGRIKKKYDETIEGVSFHLEDGQLLINGINVGACLRMVRRRPTKKGRIFLKGLRNRLAILQSNRQGNPNYEKIRETVERLAEEIDQELKHPTVIELPPPTIPRLESSSV